MTALASANRKGGKNYNLVYGSLHRWLAAPTTAADPGPMRSALREFIIQNMDVGVSLFGEPVDRRSKHTVNSLSKVSQLPQDRLRKALVNSKVINEGHRGRSDVIVTFDAKAGIEVAEALRQTIFFADLPKALHTSKQIAKILVDLGALKHRASDGRAAKGIDSLGCSQTSVDRLLDHLYTVLPELNNVPATWKIIARCRALVRAPMQTILQMLIAGQIPKVGRAPGEFGFDAVRVSVEGQLHLCMISSQTWKTLKWPP